MQKKLIAVAVAGALGVPAFALAQTATVSVSGRMYVEYSYANTGAGAGGTINRVNSDVLQTPGSNISFQGEEKLGGNMSAWFKCESTAEVRGMSQDGFCGRNSAVGLKGAFGNAFVGNWHTPFTRARNTVGANETGLWGTAALLTGHSTTVSDGGSGAADPLRPQLFARRQNHSIHYETPSFSGFQAMGMFSSANASTSKTQSAANKRTRIMSVAATYNNGPLKLSAGYEGHADFAANGAGETGWLVGASYRFANRVTFGGMYTRQKWGSDTATASGSGRVNAWQLGIDWSLGGPHRILAAYTNAGDVKGGTNALGVNTSTAIVGGLRTAAGADTGAYMIQMRYQYALSKRTDWTVGFNRVKNDRNAGYGLNGYAPNGGVGPATGARHTGFGTAIDHRF